MPGLAATTSLSTSVTGCQPSWRARASRAKISSCKGGQRPRGRMSTQGGCCFPTGIYVPQPICIANFLAASKLVEQPCRQPACQADDDPDGQPDEQPGSTSLAGSQHARQMTIRAGSGTSSQDVRQAGKGRQSPFLTASVSASPSLLQSPVYRATTTCTQQRERMRTSGACVMHLRLPNPVGRSGSCGAAALLLHACALQQHRQRGVPTPTAPAAASCPPAGLHPPLVLPPGAAVLPPRAHSRSTPPPLPSRETAAAPPPERPILA